MDFKKPTQHRMTRRAAAHDYTRPGLYHITLHVAEGLGQPLGAVVGSTAAPDGSPEAPHTALSPTGRMVENELLTAIHAHYPMVIIDTYVIMPEHLHFILEVQDRIISHNGKTQTIGQIIAGFKQGCNRRYWELLERPEKPAATLPLEAPSPSAAPLSLSAVTVNSGFAAVHHPPLFAAGYCDVMPVDAAQLATQRAYIAGNPRSRLLRTSNRAWLMPHRASITTALTLAALRRYLQRECPPHLATPEALAAIESHLFIAAPSAAPTPYTPNPYITPSAAPSAGSVSGGFAAGNHPRPLIACDTFGNTALITKRPCLPVVCHRKDKAHFEKQKARCLEEARRGTTLVSARIAKGEQDILNETVRHGFPVALITDNGLPERYHPSADRLALCAEGRLLIIAPWRYIYRPDDAPISVPACKTMNCIAQALCRTKDTWWQTTN